MQCDRLDKIEKMILDEIAKQKINGLMQKLHD